MAQRPILVNRNWLPNLWGDVPAEEDKWLSVNLDNNDGFQRFINEGLKPSFQELPLRQQHRLKETFRYALTQFDETELAYAFDSCGLPLTRPQDEIRAFYIRIWQAMFGTEDFTQFDPMQYLEVDGSVQSMWS
ncbi:hypothetical protein [Deinococcus marmoris]|uniref:hypothetical protein n=1 Tax=Deinococcus marmoris TaxID=249408 RepID=UPI0004976BD1|nr:hypothetical protein [Deinococcus marmoris]